MCMFYIDVFLKYMFAFTNCAFNILLLLGGGGGGGLCYNGGGACVRGTLVTLC